MLVRAACLLAHLDRHGMHGMVHDKTASRMSYEVMCDRPSSTKAGRSVTHTAAGDDLPRLEALMADE